MHGGACRKDSPSPSMGSPVHRGDGLALKDGWGCGHCTLWLRARMCAPLGNSVHCLRAGLKCMVLEREAGKGQGVPQAPQH